MSVNRYQFYYAVIDLETGECYAVEDTTVDCSGEPNYIELSEYNEEYIFKFYYEGNWYEDEDYTIQWIPN